MSFTFGVTAQTVVIGMPIAGLTPETGEVMHATGRPFASTFGEGDPVIAPTQAAPATASPKQAIGNPFTIDVSAPGPTIMSPVAVAFAIVITGIGIVSTLQPSTYIRPIPAKVTNFNPHETFPMPCTCFHCDSPLTPYRKHYTIFPQRDSAPKRFDRQGGFDETAAITVQRILVEP